MAENRWFSDASHGRIPPPKKISPGTNKSKVFAERNFSKRQLLLYPSKGFSPLHSPHTWLRGGSFASFFSFSGLKLCVVPTKLFFFFGMKADWSLGKTSISIHFYTEILSIHSRKKLECEIVWWSAPRFLMGLAEKYGTQTVKGNESPLSLETVFFHAIGGRVPLGIKPSFVFGGRKPQTYNPWKTTLDTALCKLGCDEFSPPPFEERRSLEPLKLSGKNAETEKSWTPQFSRMNFSAPWVHPRPSLHF